MGRYYEGDIEGKFWFGVQSSTAADRFGSTYVEPNYVDYYYSEDDLPQVEKELQVIETTIGKVNFALLDKFFEECDGYNDQIMNDFHPELLKIYNKHKSDYADYGLGKKIRDCIKENGECSFTAEL